MKKTGLLLIALLLIGKALIAQDTLTIASGTQRSDGLPVSAMNITWDQHNQVLYPASMLTNLPEGATITELKFYTNATSTFNYGPGWVVRITEVTDTAFATNAFLPVSNAETVYNGILQLATDHCVSILFDQGYLYNGGSLLLDFMHDQDLSGSYRYVYFYGLRGYSNAVSWHGSNYDYSFDPPYLSDFIPKVSIIYQASDCPQPANLTLTDLNDTAAAFLFRPVALDSLWTVRVWSASDSTQNFLITDTLFSVQHLTENTEYNVMVRTVCGPSDTSAGAYYSFHTPCGYLPIPFFTNFDGYPRYMAGQVFINVCWHHINNYTFTQGSSIYTPSYPLIYDESYFAHSGSHAVKFMQCNNQHLTQQMVVLPEIDTATYPVNRLTLSFWARDNNNARSGVLSAGVLSDPDDATTFTAVSQISLADTYQLFTIPFNSYGGSGTYLAISSPNLSGSWTIDMYVDDLSVEAPPTYHVTTVALDSATRDTLANILVNGSGSHLSGTTVTLQAPDATSLHFCGWTDGDTLNPRPFVITCDTAFTALYAINRYQLQVLSSDSSQGSVSGSGVYTHGDTATLTATAYAGSHFMQWSDGDSNASRTLVVTHNDILTATFAHNPEYIINGQSADIAMGSVTGSGCYYGGETVTLTAVPKEGYLFEHWSNESTDNPLSFTVTQDVELTAYFIPEESEGIGDVRSGLSVGIYPNPAGSSTTISLSGVNGEVTIAVVDLNGRTVQTSTMECSGNCVKHLEVRNLPRGAYFVRVYGESINTVKKLIVK